MLEHCSQPIGNGGYGKRRYEGDHSHKNGIFDLILATCVIDEPTQAFPEQRVRGFEP